MSEKITINEICDVDEVETHTIIKGNDVYLSTRIMKRIGDVNKLAHKVLPTPSQIILNLFSSKDIGSPFNENAPVHYYKNKHSTLVGTLLNTSDLKICSQNGLGFFKINLQADLSLLLNSNSINEYKKEIIKYCVNLSNKENLKYLYLPTTAILPSYTTHSLDAAELPAALRTLLPEKDLSATSYRQFRDRLCGGMARFFVLFVKANTDQTFTEAYMLQTSRTLIPIAAQLPNVYTDGHVCLGAEFANIMYNTPQRSSLLDMATKCFTYFKESEFNRDLMTRSRQYFEVTFVEKHPKPYDPTTPDKTPDKGKVYPLTDFYGSTIERQPELNQKLKISPANNALPTIILEAFESMSGKLKDKLQLR